MTPKKTKEIELEKMLEAILDTGITEEGLSSAFKQLKNKREEEKKREAAYEKHIKIARGDVITAIINYIEVVNGKTFTDNNIEILSDIIEKLLLDYEETLPPAKKPKIDVKILKKEDITEEMADRIIRDMLRGRG